MQNRDSNIKKTGKKGKFSNFSRSYNSSELQKKPKPNPFSKYKSMDYAQLKTAGIKLEPILRLGKSGLSDSVISEIKLHLQKRHLIKIKYLPAFLDLYDRREISHEIAKKCDAKLVQQIGGTLVLFKK